MARKKGTLKLSSNIEPTVAAPLDAREVVDSIADLTAEGSFPYAYDGMRVSVKASHAVYMFKGGDTTDIDNWAKIGSDGEMDSYYTKSETDELLSTKADEDDVETALAGKVDNDTLNNYYDKTEVDTALSGKVDKVNGKGLSTEDYTTADKNKLSGIATGAEVNVQSDFSQSDSTADDYIKNKPTLGTAASKDVPVSGDASATQVVTGDDSRLTDARTPVSHTHTLSEITDAGAAAGYDATNAVTSGSGDLVTSGAVWTAIDNLPEPLVFKGTLGAAADSPTITALPTASAVNEGWLYLVITAGTYASIVAKVGDRFACATLDDGTTYEWIKLPAGDVDIDTWRNIKVNGTEKLSNAKSSGGVDFVDGTNTIVSFDADGNKIKIDAIDTTYDLATQSVDGLMSSTDKTKLDGIESGAQANAVTSVAGKTGAVSLEKSDVGLGNVPNVTTDNQTPTISEASTRANLASGDTLATIIGKIKKFFSDLKAVAFSGSYNDLSDQPTIPTVNNATLTIQKNGTTVETFTANASSNKTANITVPSADESLSGLPAWTATPTDDTYLVRRDTAGTAAYGQVKFSTVWKYINSKLKTASYGGTGNTTKIKININSQVGWMLCFTVTLYQGYRATKVMVSGYQYGSNHWYEPEARLLGDSNGTETISVYFGYDGTNKLWVGFDGGNYTGVVISDVVNGYTQIGDYAGLFTISNVSSLTTLQTTVTAASKANYANSAGSAPASDVYAWAKASTKPSYAYSEISGTPTIPTKVSQLTNDSGYITSYTDTKNTAGTTNTTSKIYLAGATSQAANPQTYSNSSCYASGGKLYSNAKEVVNLSDSQALTNKTYNGYTLGAACAKAVASSIADGTTGLTTGDVVYDYVNAKSMFATEILSDTSNLRVVAQKIWSQAVIISITCYAYSASSGGTIATLSTGMRPSAVRYSGGVFCNSAGTGMIYQAITVNTNGTIKTSAAWSSLYGQITAIIKL